MTTPREDAIAARRQRERELVARNHAAGMHGGIRVRGCEACSARTEALCECGHEQVRHYWTCDQCGHKPPYMTTWVDLASPETAEALARALCSLFDLGHCHDISGDSGPVHDAMAREDADAILAAMRKTGR